MRKSLLVAAGLVAVLGGAAQAQEATATFLDAEGQEIGSATLAGTPEGVLIAIELAGLPPESWVGFHIHETGSCDHADGHQSAGGHFNPTGKAHGYLAEGGPHAGDMPNQYVAADGVLRAQVFNSFVSLDSGENGILGRALMVHGGTDDYLSQPAGDAGSRAACAVIE